jgi:ketosteroid isomerase-like protein
MTNTQAHAFAAEWIDNFNRLDLEAVLAHFAEEVCLLTTEQTPAAKPVHK